MNLMNNKKRSEKESGRPLDPEARVTRDNSHLNKSKAKK